MHPDRDASLGGWCRLLVGRRLGLVCGVITRVWRCAVEQTRRADGLHTSARHRMCRRQLRVKPPRAYTPVPHTLCELPESPTCDGRVADDTGWTPYGRRNTAGSTPPAAPCAILSARRHPASTHLCATCVRHAKKSHLRRSGPAYFGWMPPGRRHNVGSTPPATRRATCPA